MKEHWVMHNVNGKRLAGLHQSSASTTRMYAGLLLTVVGCCCCMMKAAHLSLRMTNSQEHKYDMYKYDMYMMTVFSSGIVFHISVVFSIIGTPLITDT
jgi:hypothetical protein